MRLRSLLVALGINAVPAVGWLAADWSEGTTLVLYWVETVIGAGLMAGRIWLHGRARPSRGHWDYQAPQGSVSQRQLTETPPPLASYLAAFLEPTMVFSAAHGVFLAVLGIIFLKKHLGSGTLVEVDELMMGVGSVAILQGVDFLLDVGKIRSWSFRELEAQGQQTLSRVLVIHLTLIGGMAAVMLTGADRKLFAVFILVKLLMNCSSALTLWTPKKVEATISAKLREAKESEGEGMAALWQMSLEQERAREAWNEERKRASAKRRKEVFAKGKT